MRAILQTFCFLALGISTAFATSKFPEDIVYMSPIPGGQELSVRQMEDVKDLHKFFLGSEFEAMNQNLGDGQEFFGVDQIFARYSDNKVVYMMFNVAPKNKGQMRRLYKMEDHFVYHGVSPNGISYAMLFQNFSEIDAEYVTDLLEQHFVATLPNLSTELLASMLIPSAHAAETGHSDGKTTVGKSSNISSKTIPTTSKGSSNKNVVSNKEAAAPMQVVERNFMREVTSSIGRCTGDVIYGAVDSTVGFAVRSLRTLCRLFVKPRDVWNNTVYTFQSIWGSIKNAHDEGILNFSKERLRQWWSKGGEARRQDVCEFIGSILGYWLTAHYLPKAGIYKNTKNQLNKWNHRTGINTIDQVKDTVPRISRFFDKPTTKVLQDVTAGAIVYGTDRLSRIGSDNGKCLGNFF